MSSIDLSNYRTSELAEEIVELLSLREAGKTILFTAIKVAVVCLLLVGLLLAWVSPHAITWVLTSVYALAAGIGIGVLLGFAQLFRAAFASIEKILGDVLQLTMQVADDYQQLQTGEVKLPSGGELLGQVYEQIVLPVIEKAVAGTLGFLGTPLLWAYRLTIGGAVRQLIRRVHVEAHSESEQEALREGAEAALELTASYRETIGTYVEHAKSVVTVIVKHITRWIVRPLQVAFGVLVGLALTPVGAMVWISR